jgi:ParB family transcriptional regulator, chromosome partitioning protein
MRSALGKGLGALISDEAVATVSAAPAKAALVNTVPIERVRSNPKQPRRTFSEEALADLVVSIKQNGILQPIVVSPTEGGTFEIVAGERRWRAAQRAGLKEVPVVFRSGSEVERFEMSLIENLQREDLNPVDLAEGFKRLQDEFQMTQEAIAQVVAKDRSVVANTLRFLGLPEEIKQALRDGKITAGHAKALLAVEDPATQEALFKQILAGELTVRHVEQAARDRKRGKTAAAHPPKPADLKALEEELQRILTRKVEIHSSGLPSNKGWIKLEFYSLDDFETLINHLKRTGQ